MICPNCQNRILDDSKFCPFCGKKTDQTQNLPIKETASRMPKPAPTKVTESKRPKPTPSTKLIKTEKPKTTTTSYIIPDKEKKGASTAFTWLASLLVIALLISTCYLLYERNELLTTIEARNRTIASQNKTIDSQADSIAEYKDDSEIVDTVRKWGKKYGKSFRSQSDYKAGSNAVIVRVGESASISISYSGKRTVWLSQSNNNVTAEWGKNIKTVKVTGKKAGTSELIFSLGNKKKADSKESFRVLVIVVDKN